MKIIAIILVCVALLLLAHFMKYADSRNSEFAALPGVHDRGASIRDDAIPFASLEASEHDRSPASTTFSLNTGSAQKPSRPLQSKSSAKLDNPKRLYSAGDRERIGALYFQNKYKGFSRDQLRDVYGNVRKEYEVERDRAFQEAYESGQYLVLPTDDQGKTIFQGVEAGTIYETRRGPSTNRESHLIILNTGQHSDIYDKLDEFAWLMSSVSK